MKIVFVSDTHCQHRRINVPDGDVFVHAGDFLLSGNMDELASLQDFNTWLGELPHKHKLLTFGNHDRMMEMMPAMRAEITNARVFVDQWVEVDGVSFYLSPWTPRFPEGSDYWKFMRERNQMYTIWERIPPKTDVLVTHGPPYGGLDMTPYGRAGDEALRRIVARVRPRIHAFGHIHEGYGRESTIQPPESRGTLFLNCSQVDAAYRLVNKPWVVEL